MEHEKERVKFYMGLKIDTTLYNFLKLLNILQDFYTECQRHNTDSNRTHCDLKSSFYWNKTLKGHKFWKEKSMLFNMYSKGNYSYPKLLKRININFNKRS